jgi:hypothetical protein
MLRPETFEFDLSRLPFVGVPNFSVDPCLEIVPMVDLRFLGFPGEEVGGERERRDFFSFFSLPFFA